MNYKKIFSFFGMTYLITWFFWWLRALLTTANVIDVNSIEAWLLYVCGSLGPTIAAISFLDDKSLNGIKKFIFDHKKGTLKYLLFFVIVYLVAFYTSKFEIVSVNALLTAPIMLLVYTLFCGGNEELGWRCIVQPEL